MATTTFSGPIKAGTISNTTGTLADFTATDGDGTTGVGTVTVLYMQNNSVQDAVDL
jgi:hypothetical protein